MMNKIYGYIYLLIDPRNKKIRYVGKTIDLKRRFWSHFNIFDNTRKSKWIKQLKNKNLIPLVKVIFKTKIHNLDYCEKYFIKKLKKNNNLTNLTDGGDGIPIGFKFKKTKKRKDSLKARQKKVIAYNLKTGKEKIFESIKKCAKWLKADYRWISQVLKKRPKKLSVKGYNIRYFGEKLNIIKKKYLGKRVKRIHLKTKKFKIYTHLYNVKKDNFSPSAVSAVCLGRQNRKQYRGYKWEYINE